MDRGIPIRAISRGLAILAAISRNGPLTLKNIAVSVSLPYPTTDRIVQTLLQEGFVERDPSRKVYRVTPLVQTLSVGFQTEGRFVTSARTHITELCRDVSWPISITRRVGAKMMVLDSTHKMSSLAFSDYPPGFTLPIAQCASGKIHIAFCGDEDKQAILNGLAEAGDHDSKSALEIISEQSVFDEIRSKGCAFQLYEPYSLEPGKTSTMSVPVFDDYQRLIGALNLTYFRSSITADKVETQYLDKLRDVSRQISKSYSAILC